MGVAKMAGSVMFRRDIVQDVKTAPQTFSSWHNCMQKAYCKWPAIIGIVVGSLIVVSLVWCLISCLCCGVSCCRSCLSCCSCCGGGNDNQQKRSKYADSPSYPPAPFQPNPYHGYRPAPAPPSYEPPRFAQFDAPTKVEHINDDALPAMPSWDHAASRKVEVIDHNEAVEMDHLENKSGQQNGIISNQGQSGPGGYSQVPSNPPTPHFEQPSGYRGGGTTNPYAATPNSFSPGAGAAAGGAIDAAYIRTSPTQGHYPVPLKVDTRQAYSNEPASPEHDNFGYGQRNATSSPYKEGFTPVQGTSSYGQGSTSPYHDVPTPGAFQNSHSLHYSPQTRNEVPSHTGGSQPQQPYTAYTPSTSTQFEPQIPPSAQQAAIRPPSLLTPGRRPAPQW